MANRIKGITVEIGGDTTKLSKALESVNKNIKSTQTQLKDVEKLLKLDPKNTELLSQKQKLLADSISATKELPQNKPIPRLPMVKSLRNSMTHCSVRLSKRNRNSAISKPKPEKHRTL